MTITQQWGQAFPKLPSYQRFIEWIPSTQDKLLSRKRCIIETIIDQLKNISQIEHSRHRSPVNFCVNVLFGLIAYCHQPKKPSLQMDWLLSQSA